MAASMSKGRLACGLGRDRFAWAITCSQEVHPREPRKFVAADDVQIVYLAGQNVESAVAGCENHGATRPPGRGGRHAYGKTTVLWRGRRPSPGSWTAGPDAAGRQGATRSDAVR